MFPLNAKTFPSDAAILRDALEESLRRVLSARSQMVTVADKIYPQLQAIRISLDGARADAQPPLPASPAGAIEPALRVEQFEVSGRPVLVQGAAIDLSCTARDVKIGQARDSGGNLLLLLQNAAEGKVEISMRVADLESLVLAGAKTEAGKQGVTVEDVKIELRSRTERSLDASVQVRARKLFLSATVRITGGVEIDDQLNAKLSGLGCTGEGTLGTLACSFLTPQLQRFDNREFSLLALPLGELQLGDIKMAIGDKLAVTANFASRA